MTRHDAGGSSSGPEQEAQHDPDVPTPSHAEQARTLLERVRTGTLCTLAREPPGHPYGSFVSHAILPDGDPVLLVSTLAEHTQNLLADARASLLVAEPGDGDPLARARVTIVAMAELLEPGADAAARATYLAAHPGAADYADFRDFAFWRLTTLSVRFIGGFGRMSWLDLAAYRAARPAPIAHAQRG